MKRHESMAALSREHHFALLFCWKIRQGFKKQVLPERIQPYVKYFWENHLLPHFKEEETLLFAILQDSLVEQAISDHKYIKQQVENVIPGKAVQADQLNTLAGTLDAHIRFEERTLFPHLERELPEDKLVALGSHLQQLHQMHEKDNYMDEFWIITDLK